MRKLLSALALMAVPIGPVAVLNTAAPAQADPITFGPEWFDHDHSEQTKHTICDALAQGWSRAQIVDAAQQANDSAVTGLTTDDARLRADAMIDAARYMYCRTLDAG